MIYKLAKIDRHDPCCAGAYILIAGCGNKQTRSDNYKIRKCWEGGKHDEERK